MTFAGCDKKHPVDKVTYVADDDPKMNAAMEKARSTVNTFIAVLKGPKSGQTSFSVKMACTDGGNTEHMWLSPVSFDGRMFHGTVNNEPENVKSIKMGQKVSLSPRRFRTGCTWRTASWLEAKSCECSARRCLPINERISTRAFRLSSTESRRLTFGRNHVRTR